MGNKLLNFCLFLSLFLIIEVNAETRDNFINNIKIYKGESIINKLSDNNYYTYEKFSKNDNIIITSSNKIYSIYIVYSLESSLGTLTYNNINTTIGENNFLHEYVELEEPSHYLELNYNKDVNIKEIFAFGESTPSWVQKWKPPLEDADILLFSTHSDDEHLFFAGLIPTMVNLDKKMQIVYFTRHDTTPIRFDELLNGLWVAGISNYPVFGIVPDAFSKSINSAKNNLKKANLDEEKLIKFDVDIIRKFKPEVIVSHDEKGEYGHGQHMLCTYILEKSIPYFNDDTFDSSYDTFEPYKIYIHLYEENKITMNYDIPLEKFNNLTAFQVSKKAFDEHVSQHKSWFKRWLNGDKGEYKSATEIKKYSPLNYGLYYSRVGYENLDNDMFYNIPENKKIEEPIEEAIKDSTPIIAESKRSNTKHRNNLIKITIIILSIDIILIVIKRKK